MNLSQESIEKIIVGVVTAIVILFLSEPIKAAFRKIGAWMEGFFQSLGFGFRKRYYRALIQAHQWLKLIGIYNPSDLNAPRLQEVYVSLRMNTAKDSPTVHWNRIFTDSEKHIVVLGTPGAGKSTLLDYLTLIFTGHIKHSLRTDLNNPLPVFVRLRDLGDQSLLSLIESPANAGLTKIPPGYFERHLKTGKCIVLLDGLDEVLDESAHKQTVSKIQNFANEYPDNRIVVTCRVAGWRNQLPAFRQYSVQEFDRDDVRQFIGAWYREVTRNEEINKLGGSPKPELTLEAEERARLLASKPTENLWNALLKNESLLRIARTPLILSLVTLVHKNRTANLPQGRARLYRECLDILLDIWDSKDKGLVSPDSPSPNDKLLVLKTIAFHYLEQGLLELDIEGLEALVAPLLPSLTKPVGAKSLIRQIYERSGVLVEQAIGKYGFAHRALHDYLAAKHAEEHNLDTILLDHAADERWREVILIAIGLVQPKQRAETLLSSLLRQSDTNAAGLALAGWSLAEDIQISDELRSSVREKIQYALEHTQAPGDFSLLSGAFFDTDPSAMQSWIGAALSGRNVELQTRVLTALIPDLGLEQSKPFLPTLIQVLADAHAVTRLRAHCALVVAKLKPVADTELWNALFSAARDQYDETLKSAATWAYCELGGYEKFGLIKIPAGEFLMGSADADQNAANAEKPQHTLFLPTYYIAKYPVTVGEYQSFINGSGYKTSDPRSVGRENDHPVVYVSWTDALAYARWCGMTLPSEAEWEKAARGPSTSSGDGRIYPWGNDWKNGYANTYEYWKTPRSLWDRLRRKRNQQATTTPVGSFPQGNSPYGCADMSGNVWEWTRSAYKEYPYDASDGREDESATGFRVLRGGSFSNYHWFARCASRYRLGPNFFYDDFGFRVCVSPILSL
ncbi:MAG: SUMF1/EgtB/PvdO family nonheme iron enzyme [Anaerolineales bacterium]|nr:SUMF1/EgtB/PvdO family nonheme iron enzyme [Anaerolineales bacterium]